MFDKIWSRHVVAEGPGGHALLYIDRHLLHEGATHAFGRLERAGRSVRRPDLSFATADHYVLTSPGSPALDAEIGAMMAGESDLDRVCDRLIGTANNNGGLDNVTVVAVRLERD